MGQHIEQSHGDPIEAPPLHRHFDKIVSLPEVLAAWVSSESFVAFPIKVCVVCGEEFELKPDKPGFANRCPDCTEPEADDSPRGELSADSSELNQARREAMRNLLYRKDS